MAEIRRVPIIILGLGNIGQALLRQIRDARSVLLTRGGLQLPLFAVADSQAILFNPVGLDDETLRAALQVKTEGGSLSTLPGSRSPSHLPEALAAKAVLVDATASANTSVILRTALDAGCGVVLANKHPLSGSLSEARFFMEHPRLRYEATVGAGLPVITTLRTLLNTGDKITRIEGCLSGTLGYLCTELQNDAPYSAAVARARALGYTEPDPRDDLSGRDVARKALILARTSGWPFESTDLVTEPMYPENLSNVTTEQFMAATPSLDEPFADRIRKARSSRQVLRYVAAVTPHGGQVGLSAVDQEGALGALKGPASFVALHTSRYAKVPLVISGPGAGPEVTAAGVMADIINLALLRTQHTTHQGLEQKQ